MNISSMGGSAGLAAMQQALFKTLDKDEDGQISSTEFQAIGQALPGDGKKGAHKAQGSSGQGFGTETMGAMLSAQEDRFAKSDTDGDGKLSAEEIAAGMAAHVPPGATGDTSAMAANFVSKADANGDGSISEDEFKAAAPKGPPHGGGHGGPPPAQAANDSSSTKQADPAKTTNPADTNGDGSVSAAEMLAYLQGAANDMASSTSSDASGKMQDLLAQLSKYGQSDAGTTAAKVA